MQDGSTNLFSPEAPTPSSVVAFPDYIDLLSSPTIKSDVLSNRFGVHHNLPSAFNEEVVMQLAEFRRVKSLHATIRPEQARLPPVPEEISSTPYYALQPLSIWQYPTKGIGRYPGIGRYRSGYVKLPPGSYNDWITCKRDGEAGEGRGGSMLGAAVMKWLSMVEEGHVDPQDGG